MKSIEWSDEEEGSSPIDQRQQGMESFALELRAL